MLNDEALTADEVAGILHVSKKKVYELARSETLASYKIGRKLFFALKDVQDYLARSRSASPAGEGAASTAANASEPAAQDAIPWEGALQDSFIVAGNGLAADLIAERLNALGLAASRAYRPSYQGLVDLYRGHVDATLIHLYDQRTNSYNVPFVQRLAPGTPLVVFHLLRRQQGFAVAKGNPKGLRSWGALLKPGVRLANRARGCGSRILLDEKLLGLEAWPEAIAGYDSEHPSGHAAALAVAHGRADVAVVGEQIAAQVPDVQFVPLQAEWLDLAVAKRPHYRDCVRAIRAIMGDDAFKSEFSRIVHGSDTGRLGSIVYEC